MDKGPPEREEEWTNSVWSDKPGGGCLKKEDEDDNQYIRKKN